MFFGFGKSHARGERRQFYVIYMEILKKKTAKNVTVVQGYKNPGRRAALATRFCSVKDKAIPLEAWTDSEGSRRLRLPA